MRATLRITTPERSRSYELAEGQKVLLGRSESCEIVVADNSVSRRHCSLLLEGGALHVSDLGSSHGIKRDKKLVAECTLRAGDQVEVGLVTVLFESLGDADSMSRADTQPDPDSKPLPAHRDLIGETLGGYRIMSMLGAGGQAVVYAAEQTRLGREVALKVLRKPETDATAESVASFLREARAAAALSDPSLVQVFDLGFDLDRHFLSMELVRGGSLAARIRQRGPMGWAEFEPILFDVLEALTVAHEAGIVHRDVKPANILLTLDGRAKLADLGLARGIGGEGDRSGTPAYMAPEQVHGSTVDARADLYALGCTIYHALTGAPPFVGRSRDIIRQKLDGSVPDLPADLKLPDTVRRLLQSLLSKDPALRPADARAVAPMLRTIPTKPRSPAPRRQRRAHQPRNPKLQALAWIAAVAAVALVASELLRRLPQH